jgi:hypothetical protein
VKLVYVAGPFRGPSHWAIAQNVRNAEAAALEVWRMGAACLCPHANTAHFQDAAPDHIWLRGDLEMLRRCDAILMLPTWRQSAGAVTEHDWAVRHEMPILYSLGELKDWLAHEADG